MQIEWNQCCHGYKHKSRIRVVIPNIDFRYIFFHRVELWTKKMFIFWRQIFDIGFDCENNQQEITKPWWTWLRRKSNSQEIGRSVFIYSRYWCTHLCSILVMCNRSGYENIYFSLFFSLLVNNRLGKKMDKIFVEEKNVLFRKTLDIQCSSNCKIFVKLKIYDN